MTEDTHKCPEGWNPGQLLAYLEGALPEDTARELELHLRGCSVCSEELKATRQADALLRAHPEVFHPDTQTLVNFVTEDAAENPELSKHLETCPDCMAEVDILRETLGASPKPSALPPPMPRELRCRIQRMHGRPEAETSLWKDWYDGMVEWLRVPFRAPMLGLGTAVAALLIIVFVMPVAKDIDEAPLAPTRVLQPPAVLEPKALEEIATEEEEITGKRAGESRRRTVGAYRGGISSEQLQLFESTVDFEENRKAAVRPTLKDVPSKDSKLRTPPEPRLDYSLQEGKPIPGPTSGDIRHPIKTIPTSPKPADKIESRDAAPRPSEMKQEGGRDVPRPTLFRQPEVSKEKRVRRRKPLAGVPDSHDPAKTMRKAPPQEGFDASKTRPEKRSGIVEVQIVDQKGRAIPWLKFVPSRNLLRRYHFQDFTDEDAREEDGWKDKIKRHQKPGIPVLEPTSMYLVKVEVSPSGPNFDFDARLIETVSGKDQRRIQVLNVSKEDLEARIQSVVSSMLKSN